MLCYFFIRRRQEPTRTKFDALRRALSNLCTRESQNTLNTENGSPPAAASWLARRPWRRPPEAACSLANFTQRGAAALPARRPLFLLRLFFVGSRSRWSPSVHHVALCVSRQTPANVSGPASMIGTFNRDGGRGGLIIGILPEEPLTAPTEIDRTFRHVRAKGIARYRHFDSDVAHFSRTFYMYFGTHLSRYFHQFATQIYRGDRNVGTAKLATLQWRPIQRSFCSHRPKDRRATHR